MKRGRGMKDRIDKSRGIVTLMTETLTNIQPIESLRYNSSLINYMQCVDCFYWNKTDEVQGIVCHVKTIMHKEDGEDKRGRGMKDRVD